MGSLCYQNQWFPKLVENPGPPTPSQRLHRWYKHRFVFIKPAKFSGHPNTLLMAVHLGSRSIWALRRQTDQLRAEETVWGGQPRKHELLQELSKVQASVLSLMGMFGLNCFVSGLGSNDFACCGDRILWMEETDRNMWLMMVKFYFSHYAYIPFNEQELHVL